MKNIYDIWNNIRRNHIDFIKSNNYTIKYVKELYDNLFKDESVSRNIDNG